MPTTGGARTGPLLTRRDPLHPPRKSPAVWHNLLHSDVSYLETAVRTILVYLTLLVLLRLVGRRDLAQLNTFDLVVMLLLTNVVQNAAVGPDDSVPGTLFGGVVLLAANSVVVRCAARFAWFGRALEGRPLTLARDGVPRHRALARLGLRVSDLSTAVRRQGGDDVEETSQVTLQPGGALMVDLKRADQSADKADIDELRTALCRIEQRLDATERRATPPAGGTGSAE